MQHFVDHVEEIPVIVLVGLERYRAANPYEGASVYPACQNLLLAARALGYGGALTGWHHAVEAELRSLLGIPDDVALSACITLGVPAGRHGPLRRKPLRELVHDGRWGRAADVARGPGRWLTTRTPSSASRRAQARRSCGRPGAAWPRSSTPTTPAARPRRMRRLNAAFDAALADASAPVGPPDAATGVPSRRRRPPPVPRPGGRVAHDVASFTIEALPAEAFEALLIVATWLGEVLVDEPPYQLDVALGEPFELLVPPRPRPRRRASTVALTLASLDGRPVPDLDAVRDAWVADLNTLGRPDP